MTYILYNSYSSSQNYYYTRDINDILSNALTNNVIYYRDLVAFDEVDEYLKRFYLKKELPNKIYLLSEYYKFHRDIPRLFMFPAANTISRYHDKKRSLEYARITRMMKYEGKDKC